MSKKVFFLGAGFSKSINPRYPLLKELTNNVSQNFEKQILNTYYKFDIFDKFKNNIEYLLTYLSTDLPWKSEKVKAMNKALYIEITEKIQKYFLDLELFEQTNFTQYTEFAKFIGKPENTIITLNYDLMAEKLIYSVLDTAYTNVNKNFIGFYKCPILPICLRYSREASFGFRSGNADEYGEQLPRILKLHGSINWLWAGMNPTDQIYCRVGFENIDYHRDLIPYMIPPVLDKNSFYNNNILKGIWQQAYEKIAEADEIFIIGFSFPPTDLSLRYLFNSALSNNQNVNIYVINYDSNNTQSTYKKIFDDKQLECNKENNNWKYCGKNGFSRFISDFVTNATQTTV